PGFFWLQVRVTLHPIAHPAVVEEEETFLDGGRPHTARETRANGQPVGGIERSPEVCLPVEAEARVDFAACAHVDAHPVPRIGADEKVIVKADDATALDHRIEFTRFTGSLEVLEGQNHFGRDHVCTNELAHTGHLVNGPHLGVSLEPCNAAAADHLVEVVPHPLHRSGVGHFHRLVCAAPVATSCGAHEPRARAVVEG